MFKIALLFVALTIAAVSAQEAAPEPYSYGYESENHGASESRDPSGKVTGFYTLTDADGRARRVEYYADETGFHAKVQTNEIGTKSESSADVEVQASPPNAEQLVYQASGAAQQGIAQQYSRTQSSYSQAPAVRQQGYYSQQTVSGAAVPVQGARTATYTSGVYQQPGYGYQSGYQAAYPAAGYGYSGQYIVSNPASSYGYYSSGSRQQVSNFNNHLPSQYYKAVQTGPAIYSAGGVGGGGRRTVSRYSSTVSNIPAYGAYSVQSSSAPAAGAASFQSRSSYSSASSAGGSPGAPNYIVLKKRASEASS